MYQILFDVVKVLDSVSKIKGINGWCGLLIRPSLRPSELYFFLPQHTVAISEITNASLFDKGFFHVGIIFKEYIKK